MRVPTTTSRFDRMLIKFVRSHPDLRENTYFIMKSLVSDPFNTKLKTHSFGGRMKGSIGASITSKYRLVFLLSDKEIRFIAVGSHDEVY